MNKFLYFIPIAVIIVSVLIFHKSPGTANFEVLQKGSAGFFDSRERLVISSFSDAPENSGKEFLGLINSDRIDFRKDLLIAVSSGEKPTGGYSIEVSSITETSSSLIVNVTEISPGKNCIVSQALSYPYEIIKLRKSAKEVVFKESSKVADCI